MAITDRVDIVVLNHNGYGNIQKCIHSIKDNTEGYNLIVVDQNSNDGSREWLIESKVASHLILNKVTVGVAKGRNQGIRAGKYPWIVFIDSDIVVEDSEWLDKLWNYTIDRRIGYIETQMFVGSERQPQFSGDMFCMVRRQCFNEIGVYDENLFIAPELDLWVRLKWNKFWKTGWCYDTCIFSKFYKLACGVILESLSKLVNDRYEEIHNKYTKEFLDITLWENYRERTEKNSTLLINKRNG